MKKKREMSSWLDNKNFLRIFSIVLAIICWEFVVLMVNPERTETVSGVPVDLSINAATLSSQNLEIIDVSDLTVSATVYGTGTVVGRLEPEDLTATVRFSRVVEADTYDLELVAVNQPGSEYEIVSYNPSTIRVRFDRLVRKTFPVQTEVNGLTIQEGYTYDREYASPEQVTVSGPQVEIDRIDRVVVRVDLEDPLEQVYAEERAITLLDVQGEEIDLEDKHLTLSQDTAQLVVRVLKQRELPLELRFQRMPRGFSAYDLPFTISNESVLVAGPADQVDKYSEIVIGTIDMRELDTSKTYFTFDVELPDGFVNLDNIYSVTVNIDTSGWGEAIFHLDEDNIRLTNLPDGYDIRILNPMLNNVLLVGDPEVLETITAEDIVVEIDLSEKDWQPGQSRAGVTITVPGAKSLVWAVGEYSLVVQVTELPDA